MNMLGRISQKSIIHCINFDKKVFCILPSPIFNFGAVLKDTEHFKTNMLVVQRNSIIEILEFLCYI